jgi:hypothetical protein
MNGSQGQGKDDNRVIVSGLENSYSIKKAVMMFNYDDVVVDKFLTDGFAPVRYGNEGNIR